MRQTDLTRQALSWRIFALKDTKDLVESGVLQGSVTRLRERFSKASSILEINRLVLWSSSNTDSSLAHMLLAFVSEPTNPKHVRLFLYKSESFDLRLIDEGLIRELRDYFVKSSFWRVSFYLNAGADAPSDGVKQFLQRLSFCFEMRLESFFIEERAPVSAELWTWHSQNSDFQAFFLPYADGSLIVSGTRKCVQSIYFLSEGESIDDDRTFLIAYAAGHADKKAQLVKSTRSPKEGLSDNMKIAYDELRMYLSGHNPVFTFKTELTCGSIFQKQVWDQLEKIPYGATSSYLDIARKISGGDDKKAHRLARAVGSACSANPLCIVTPCHRVIGSDNSLTGFNGGVHFKARLLDMELLGQTNGEKNDR